MKKGKIQMSNHNEEAISYLEKKLEHYESLLGLAKKQEEAIKSKNIEDLNSLITKKETHIENINAFDKLNIKLQGKITSNPIYLISDKRVDSLLKQLRSIITKLVNQDRDSMKLLSSTIDNIKTKTDNLNKKIRNVKSSRTQQSHTPRFIDVVQ
ncbi:MAG: flagellar export chaperone FlgN [bacterium]